MIWLSTSLYVLLWVCLVCKLSFWHVHNKLLLITTSMIHWFYICYLWVFDNIPTNYFNSHRILSIRVKQGSVELFLHNQLVIVTFDCFKIRPINNTTKSGVWHGDIKKDLYRIIIFLKYRNKKIFIKLK